VLTCSSFGGATSKKFDSKAAGQKGWKTLRGTGHGSRDTNYAKQTQFTNCPFKLNIFIDNDLYDFNLSDKSQKQTQSNPIKPNTNPLVEGTKNERKYLF
jgi:hypothetical protein